MAYSIEITNQTQIKHEFTLVMIPTKIQTQNFGFFDVLGEIEPFLRRFFNQNCDLMTKTYKKSLTKSPIFPHPATIYLF